MFNYILVLIDVIILYIIIWDFLNNKYLLSNFIEIFFTLIIGFLTLISLIITIIATKDLYLVIPIFLGNLIAMKIIKIFKNAKI